MKKVVVSLYNLFAGISPRCEVWLRKLYWLHSEKFKKYRPNTTKKVNTYQKRHHVDFNDIINYLKNQGIGDGTLLIVHSSYDVLECTGLTPEQIIEELLKLVGPSGTLAMPAIRHYKGEPKYDEILTTNTDELVCKYNPRKTMVSSGMLPYVMVKREDSEVSLHPLNPMVAIGPLAKPMMEHNLDGEAPSPHGPGSSWKFCYDHHAIIVGIGVDLYHYNTICHINEEAFGNWKWSDDEWYRLRKFDIINDDKCMRKVVKERKPEWGMIRLAELNARREYEKRNMIKFETIDGIIVGIEDSHYVIDIMRDLRRLGKSFYI